MRILHVVHQYPPDYIGGTELYTQTLAQAQAAQGHSVSIFCPSPSTELQSSPSPQVEEGVRIYRFAIGERTRQQVFLQSFRQKTLLAAFENVLSLEEPDIVHLQHLMGLPIEIAVTLKSKGIPYVITLHDYWYACANAQLITNTEGEICDGPNHRATNCGRCAVARSGRDDLHWLGGLVSPLMQYRNRRLVDVLSGADRIIAPSFFVRDKFRAMGIDSSNIDVVYHGIKTAPMIITEAKKKRAAKKNGGGLKIGFVGGISWQKGLHVLIKAVRNLPLDFGELIIYGDLSADPQYFAQLKELAGDYPITFAGTVSREQLWPALADLDILVIPSLWHETYALILDESFLVGVPVAASNVGALSERINHEENGVVFPPGDVKALADILSRLRSNPEILKRWADNIPEIHMIEDHVREIEGAYQRSLKSL